MNWQQVLVKEFKNLWELEFPDSRLCELADMFGFNHIRKLIDELSDANLNTCEKNAEWYDSFLSRLR